MKILSVLAALLLTRALAHGTTAYGTLNNFDVANDTGEKCYGFLIEIEDVRSTDITYTYDWNHYGPPTIIEDNSDPAHPRVFIRHESKRNPDGTFASFTNPQDPLNPIGPTSGHACTDTSVNLGCEHFGVGLYRSPTAVRYNWLVEDPLHPGSLIVGPAVNFSMPSFVYIPPVPPPVLPNDPPAAPARVRAVIEPPEPPEPEPDQWGIPVWVKVLKTVQPSGDDIDLDELLTDDETDPDDSHWDGGEEPETEIEWMVFQKRPPSEPGEDEFEAEDELPEGDETVTRRYEFYTYLGPVNEEDGEAQCDNPDDCPGSVGAYIGSQMAGFNVDAPLGLIDHLQDGEQGVAYVDRTVVVGGNTPYDARITSGALPDGLELDALIGILTGTPSDSGLFRFTVEATDADGVTASGEYTLQIIAPVFVSTTILPEAEETAEYSAILLGEGGVPPYAWSIDFLPEGLELAGNEIVGAPVLGTAGSYILQVTILDSEGRSASAALVLLVNPGPPIRGDVDGDRDVDRADLTLVLAGRRTPASGPDDPRDLDLDGNITILDARIVVTLFTKPGGLP